MNAYILTKEKLSFKFKYSESFKFCESFWVSLCAAKMPISLKQLQQRYVGAQGDIKEKEEYVSNNLIPGVNINAKTFFDELQNVDLEKIEEAIDNG